MTDWSDIGEHLRATREAQGLSIHDVAHQTRIPVKALHELEEGDYSSFPSPTYAKGFLSQYAKHLDLDAQEWLDQFDVAQPEFDLKQYEFLNHQEELTATDPNPCRPCQPSHSSRAADPVASSGRFNSSIFQPITVFTATAMLLSAGIFGFMKLNERLSLTINEEEQAAPVNTLEPAVSPAEFVRPLPQSTSASVSSPLAVNSPPSSSSISQLPLEEELSPPLAIDSQPPRAVIVEE